MISFKKIIVFLSFWLSCSLLNAQEDHVLKPPRDYEKHPAKTALFIELGGNAGLYSLNLDQIYYYYKEKLKLAARVGFAINLHGAYVEQAYVLEQNFILFKNPHHLELGVGITMQRQYNESCTIPDSYLWENVWYSAWRCGYRYQKQDDGFFLKVALTPIIMQQSDCGFDAHYFQLWAGVGVGMSF